MISQMLHNINFIDVDVHHPPCTQQLNMTLCIVHLSPTRLTIQYYQSELNNVQREGVCKIL